jgi:hypothetical protein
MSDLSASLGCMDEGMFWWIGGQVGRKLMRAGGVAAVMAVLGICTLKPEWPVTIAQHRAEYVAERYQSIAEGLISDLRRSIADRAIGHPATKVAPGKLAQLRRELHGP